MYRSPARTDLFANPLDPKNIHDGNSLEQLRANVEALQKVETKQTRNVFHDINDELSQMSIDERRFIENSDEYVALNQQYQNEFSSFLIEYLGPDYLRSGFGKTPETILATIRSKKDEYKNKFAKDMTIAHEQNATLIEKNNALMEMNVKLQEQLKKIQEKLGD